LPTVRQKFAEAHHDDHHAGAADKAEAGEIKDGAMLALAQQIVHEPLHMKVLSFGPAAAGDPRLCDTPRRIAKAMLTILHKIRRVAQSSGASKKRLGRGGPRGGAYIGLYVCAGRVADMKSNVGATRA
jgi:hypothetical protein